MTKITQVGITMPVVLQSNVLLDMTLRHVDLIGRDYDALSEQGIAIQLTMVLSRPSTVCAPYDLLLKLRDVSQGRFGVNLIHGQDRCVSEAWNAGIAKSISMGCHFCMVMANDVELLPGCLAGLVRYGHVGDAAVWSGLSINQPTAHLDPKGFSPCCDFSCFMLRPETIFRHGLFDTNYKPAYFEDNDYCGRIWLGGGQVRCVHSARFNHLGSQTVKHDPTAAAEVHGHFQKNLAYFQKKWGVNYPSGDRESVLQSYYKHPFNDSGKPLAWF